MSTPAQEGRRVRRVAVMRVIAPHAPTGWEVLLPQSPHRPLQVVGLRPVLLPPARKVDGDLLTVGQPVAVPLLDSLLPIMAREVSECKAECMVQ